MTKQDIRKIGMRSRDVLKQNVMKSVRSGIRIAQVAREYGINRQLIYAWRHRVVRILGQTPPNPGRPNLKIDESQKENILRILSKKKPQEVGIPCTFWTYQSVTQLVTQLVPNLKHINAYQIRKWLKSWGLDRTKEAKAALNRSYNQTNQMPAITFARQNSFRCFYLEHIRLGEIIHPYSFMVAVAPRGDIRFLPRRNYIDTALFLRQLYTICNNKLLLLYPQSRSTNHHMFYHHTIPYAISRFKDREDYHNRTLPLRKSKSITICISESSF